MTYYVLSYHIEPKVRIRGGLFLHNRDIVITDNTEIGENVSIMGQTTLATNYDRGGKIEIGDGVFLGSGCKIIASRDLYIADGVILGANAVTSKSLTEKNGVYVGIPAKFIKYKQ